MKTMKFKYLGSLIRRIRIDKKYDNIERKDGFVHARTPHENAIFDVFNTSNHKYRNHLIGSQQISRYTMTLRFDNIILQTISKPHITWVFILWHAVIYGAVSAIYYTTTIRMVFFIAIIWSFKRLHVSCMVHRIFPVHTMFTRGNERKEETNDYKNEWKLIYRRYFPPRNFHFIYLMEIVVLSYFFFYENRTLRFRRQILDFLKSTTYC